MLCCATVGYFMVIGTGFIETWKVVVFKTKISRTWKSVIQTSVLEFRLVSPGICIGGQVMKVLSLLQ